MPKQEQIKQLLDKHRLTYEPDQKGENYKIRTCVFCNNAKSNLEVHMKHGGFNCWACGQSGAFSILRSKIQSIETQDQPKAEDAGPRRTPLELNAKALRLHSNLSASLTASQYLQMRGFSFASIDHFKLGAEKLGVDWWISIPHYRDGQVVNIKYRSAESEPKKWRQESGAEKVLFNGDVLKATKDIYLVEGELKAISLHQIGVKNVVALTGGVASIPIEWIDQLREKRKVYLCLDSDEPGQTAALKLAKLIGLNKSFNIVLKDAKDPDEYFFERKHSKDDFIHLSKEAKNFETHVCFSGLKRAVDITPEKVEYLWHPYIPFQKISLLDGNPGVGKSHLALAVAAAISNGEHPWPVNFLTQLPTKDVIIFCGEDGAADTIVPRLKKLGADLENIHIFGSPITFDEKGLIEIDAMLEAQKPALVIFDPLTSFMGSRVDINRANEVREQLSQIARMAEKHFCAILIVRHLNKGSKDHAIYRGLGSIDMAAVARSILMVGKHPSDDAARVLVHIKSNLSKEGSTIQFTLNDGLFAWAGKCELTADELLYPNREAEQERLEKAKDFLIRELSTGPVDTNDLKQMAATQGFSERTLERAKAALGIKSKRVGTPGNKGSGRYQWFLHKMDDVSSEGIH